MVGHPPKSVANELVRLRKRAGLSREALAREAGYSHGSSLQRYESEAEFKEPWLPRKVAERLASALVGRGDPPIRRAEVIALCGDTSPETALAVPGVGALLDIGETTYVSIPRYDARLSAGPGALVDPQAEPLGRNLFEQQWLAALTRAAPEHLAVLRVDGDSMQDTLSDGDWVLVDRSQTRIAREGIYALQVGDVTWVKRLTLNLRDQTIRIISDNPRYPVQELTEEELQPLGRVVSVVARRL